MGSAPDVPGLFGRGSDRDRYCVAQTKQGCAIIKKAVIAISWGACLREMHEAGTTNRKGRYEYASPSTLDEGVMDNRLKETTVGSEETTYTCDVHSNPFECLGRCFAKLGIFRHQLRDAFIPPVPSFVAHRAKRSTPGETLQTKKGPFGPFLGHLTERVLFRYIETQMRIFRSKGR